MRAYGRRGLGTALGLAALSGLTSVSPAQDEPITMVNGVLFGVAGGSRVWIVTADPVWFELLRAFAQLQDDLRNSAQAIATHYEPPETKPAARWLASAPLTASDRETTIAVWARMSAPMRNGIGVWLRARLLLEGAAGPADLGLLAAQLAQRPLPDATASLFPRTPPGLEPQLEPPLAAPPGREPTPWLPTRTKWRQLVRQVANEVARSPEAAGNDARAALARAWLACTNAALAHEDSRLTDVRLMTALAHLAYLRSTNDRALIEFGGRCHDGCSDPLAQQSVIDACTPTELEALATAHQRLKACLASLAAARAALRLPPHSRRAEDTLEVARRHLTLLQTVASRCRKPGEITSFEVSDPMIEALSQWHIPWCYASPRVGEPQGSTYGWIPAVAAHAPHPHLVADPRIREFARPGPARLAGGRRVYVHGLGMTGSELAVIDEPDFIDR